MKLQLVILALCVEVTMCAIHCNQDSECTCRDIEGHKLPGRCENYNCQCGPSHHVCTSDSQCSVTNCPSGDNARCGYNHGIPGHEHYKHCHC